MRRRMRLQLRRAGRRAHSIDSSRRFNNNRRSQRGAAPLRGRRCDTARGCKWGRRGDTARGRKRQAIEARRNQASGAAAGSACIGGGGRQRNGRQRDRVRVRAHAKARLALASPNGFKRALQPRWAIANVALLKLRWRRLLMLLPRRNRHRARTGTATKRVERAVFKPSLELTQSTWRRSSHPLQRDKQAVALRAQSAGARCQLTNLVGKAVQLGLRSDGGARQR